MTNREAMELFIEKNGQETVAYPFVEKDHVVFGNGMGIEDVIEQDVTMPTVTHEEVSFKVGVGDQDVSSSIVDSSVGEMVIKGQTYQNILPEPSTHILTNDKEMFKVNEGLDSSVEIVDGVAKSAILKGQTLVNLLTYLMPNAIYMDGQYRIMFSNVNNFDKITIVNKNSKTIKFSYYTNNWREYEIPAFNNVLVEIPKEVTEYNIFALDTFGWDSTNYREAIDNIVLLHGDYVNQDIPYFEGMQSVKMPVLSTIGKNLIHVSKGYVPTAVNGGITISRDEANQTITLNGTSTIDNNCFALAPVDNLKILKGETYTITAYLISGVASGNYSFRLNDKGWSNAISTIVGGRLSNTKTYVKDALYIESSVRIDTGATFENAVFKVQFEKNTASTSYEPYKTNILSTLEPVELGGIGDVKDTLDLMTGENVIKTDEIILNGTRVWSRSSRSDSWTTHSLFMCSTSGFVASSNAMVNVVSNLLKSKSANEQWNGVEEDSISVNIDGNLYVAIAKNKLTSDDANSFKVYLSQNNIRVRGVLKEQVVKTVDLSSSGNWEKVVLDGSEDEVWHNGDPSWANKIFRLDGVRHTPNIMNSANALVKTGLLFSSHFEEKEMNNLCNLKPQPEGVSIYGDSIFVGSPQISTIGELRTWLSQNPITVWYQTTTTLDSTQVKQPIFFKDGHIQLSSGTDNSLIPTLDYQAKTSNSYVMDLMKTNTKYTMKAKSASGTFTIDGTSYGAGTNGTFTTPSSMTNKLLVMSNKTHEEVMIIEGDVVSKTIPYFKGIKSAFEDEDKIEVLSTGKNLFDKNKVLYGKSTSGNGELIDSPPYVTSDLISVKPNTNYTVKHLVVVSMYDKNGSYIGGLNANHEQRTFTTPSNCSYIRIRNWGLLDTVELQKEVLEKTVLQEGDSIETYEPYKSNNTKIPLLSPLRSLPNGVCDELIVDRTKKKATLIQRVGKAALDGGENWSYSETIHVNNVRYWHNASATDSPFKGQVVPNGVVLCSHFPNIDYGILGTQDVVGVGLKNNDVITDFGLNFPLRLLSSRNDIALKKWLSQNPIIVYYELKTPVITEVDLEGFPYIYKDGHIFLNSEIAPNTQITYSISQQHQIDASTQDLIRHEQEIDYLYKLIAQYIQVDYQSTLLSLDLKLK